MSETEGMVLAAGLGSRMRPITDTLPKPLVPVSGQPLIDHVFDRAVASGLRRLVVNAHHLPDQVETHVAARNDIKTVISDERDALLETGGGLKKALPLIGSDPFFVFNSDCLWIDGASALIPSMIRGWDPARMDMLLALAPTVTSVGYHGQGDFDLKSDGRLVRRGEKTVAPFVYMGVALMKKRVFEDTPDGPFSLNLIFDRLLEEDTLYGMRLDGLWMHVGTPEAIAEAEGAIAESAA
ncbi:MAG: nucleotidyltransferase family protein [Pseudomonadota bacterium]